MNTAATARTAMWAGLILAAGLCWSACRVTKRYAAPGTTITPTYRGVAVPDTTPIATVPWRAVFTDSLLQDLIARGIANNPDLRIAYTRIEQAEAYYRQSRAAFYPSVDANAGYSRQRYSGAQRAGLGAATVNPITVNLFQLGLSSSWEIDVWGRLRASRRAYLSNLLQNEAAARAVQTEVVAGIANYYYNLLALDQQIYYTRQTVIYWDTTVQTLRLLKEAAMVTEAAVVQSQAQRHAAAVTLPDLRQRVRETEHALSILLGVSPDTVYRSTLGAQEPLDARNTGLPAQLLANRPDVQQAEYAFRYYFELTNVARAYFYPAFTITGSAAFSSLTLADLINPAAIAANVAGGLVQPIFGRRVNRTRLDVARAQQQEALLNFQRALLNASREVSDALGLYGAAEEKIRIRHAQLDALGKSVSYTAELLRGGFGDYLEVITARQALLAAELGGVNDNMQRLQAGVNLYQALGGGWR